MKQLVALLLSLSNCAYAQFAIIYDNDGRANVRNAANITASVQNVLANEHLVYSFENDGNWANIDYYYKGRDYNGCIYKDRLKLIADYENIPLLSKQTNSVSLDKDSIKVIVTQRPFNRSKHTISYFNDTKDQIKFINGKKYWGTDGGMPAMEYKSIIIAVGRNIVSLPDSALENLFEPNIYNTQAHFDRKNNTLYIHSMNSDGAGGYEVIWRVKNGVYERRYIAYGF